jgi:hypothetical protein
MAWLFERMIELAAWVAFILGLVCFVDGVYLFVQWAIARWRGEMDVELLLQSAQAAGAFVLSVLVMGALACIDRYVYDLPESPAK